MQQAPAPAFTDKELKESEALKLRAIAMVDKLGSSSHIRRKAHRDLALWYMRLGKTAQAEEEKQVLFGLVGIANDSILYPQSGACGHLIWWKKETIKYRGACGMG